MPRDTDCQSRLTMFNTIHIEEQVADHPRTREICTRFPQATQVLCKRYGEVFNPKSQNFRLQKRKPALILARKHDRRVLEHRVPNIERRLAAMQKLQQAGWQLGLRFDPLFPCGLAAS